MTDIITPQELQELVEKRREFALFDIRKHVDFLKGHLWLSINAPHDVIESRISRYVPRLDTKVLLMDQDQNLAEEVAEGLQAMGYSTICVFGGGMNRWQESGLPTITGDYVLAHAFGLYVDQFLGTPSISASSLMQKLESQEDVLIIDSRDPADYQSTTIPGAINVPIAEMVGKIPDLINDESTQIVVHCGGVTRAVLGAQTLIDAKFANPVKWLVDGTTGWSLGGGALCRGQLPLYKPASETALTYTAKIARELAEQWNLVYLEPAEIEDWILENKQRTCYLIDVRSREDFLAGHYPDAINIPGGELVGMTQDHIATYNARLCLISDAQTARGEITASWMLKCGWNDVVLLKSWENRAPGRDPVEPGEAITAGESLPDQTEIPQPAPVSVLQASVDIKRHIYKTFMRDHPWRFALDESIPPSG